MADWEYDSGLAMPDRLVSPGLDQLAQAMSRGVTEHEQHGRNPDADCGSAGAAQTVMPLRAMAAIIRRRPQDAAEASYRLAPGRMTCALLTA
jgi:hypothetical protein